MDFDYDYEDDNALHLGDVLTDREIEEIRQQNYDDFYNAPLSMDSLGLSDRDFM